MTKDQLYRASILLGNKCDAFSASINPTVYWVFKGLAEVANDLANSMPDEPVSKSF